MSEVGDQAGFWEDLREDPDQREKVTKLFRQDLEVARQAGVEQWVEHLQNLRGVGVFAVKGTVYVPKFTKQFGDWLLKPDHGQPEITGTEEVETDDDWPYRSGRLSYLLRGVHVDSDGKVMVEAEQYTESAYPRIMYPEELDRFDLLEISKVDTLQRREDELPEGIARQMTNSE